jgi:hypothetical protein
MGPLKSLKDFLSKTDDEKEVYVSDQKHRVRRSKAGLYSRNEDCFDFIYLLQAWEEIVGPMLAKNTIPVKIKGDNLVVLTKHAIFSQELGFMAPMILEKIKERFPSFSDQVTKIKFIASERYFNMPGPEDKKEKQTKEHHPFSPDFQRKQLQAKQMFADIEDEELKELLISLYLQK